MFILSAAVLVCSDGCLYEWDVTTGTCVRFLRGHSRAVTSVQVHVCTQQAAQVSFSLLQTV